MLFWGQYNWLFFYYLQYRLYCLTDDCLQSVVIVSKLPFVALFNYLVGVIAPEFFDSGMPCLETGNSFIVLLHSLSVDEIVICHCYMLL